MSTSSRATIEQDLLRLDTQLGITNKLEKINKENRLRIIKGWLSEQDKVLLIFDNVVNHAEYTKYLPGGSVHVLGTSRDREMRNAMIMEKFSTREVEVYFERIFGEEHGYDKGDIKELGDELEGLPLAIRQAVAMLDNRGKFGEPLSIQDYLVRYRTIHRERFLDYPVPEHVSVATTVAIICEEIERQDPDCGQEAIRIADLCGFCASKAIPQELIHKWRLKGHPSRGDDREKLQRTDTCLELLSRYCMIDMGAKTVNIHQVVQAVIRVKMGANERLLYGKVVELMGEEYQFDGLDRNNSWQRCEVLHAHVMRVLGEEELFSVIPANKIAALLMDTGIFSWHKDPREFPNSKGLLLRAEKMLKEAKLKKSILMATCLFYLGSIDNPELWKSDDTDDMSDKAHAHVLEKDEKRHTEAKLNYLMLAQHILKSLDKGNPDLMAAIFDARAEIKAQLGQFDAALTLASSGISCLGDNHPRLVALAETLGDIYNKRSMYEKALEQYLRADAMCQSSYSSDHFFRLGIQLQLRLAFKEMADIENARLYFQLFLDHIGKSGCFLEQKTLTIAGLLTIGEFLIEANDFAKGQTVLGGITPHMADIHKEALSEVSKEQMRAFMKRDKALYATFLQLKRFESKKKYKKCERGIKELLPDLELFLKEARAFQSTKWQGHLKDCAAGMGVTDMTAALAYMVYRMLMECQLQQKKYDDVWGTLETVVQKIKGRDPTLLRRAILDHGLIGDHCEERGEYTNALMAYQRTISVIETQFPDYEHLLIIVYSRILNLKIEVLGPAYQEEICQKAIAVYQKYESDPSVEYSEISRGNYVRYYCLLALAQSSLGKYEESRANSRIAFSLDPTLGGAVERPALTGFEPTDLGSVSSSDFEEECDNEAEIAIVKSMIETSILSVEMAEDFARRCRVLIDSITGLEGRQLDEFLCASIDDIVEVNIPIDTILIMGEAFEGFFKRYSRSEERAKIYRWMLRLLFLESEEDIACILINVRSKLLLLLEQQGMDAEAEEEYVEGIRLVEEYGVGYSNTIKGITQYNLGLNRERQGKYEQAEEAYRWSIRLFELEEVDRDIKSLVGVRSCLVRLLEHQGRDAEAEIQCRQVLELLSKEDEIDVADMLSQANFWLGILLKEQKEYAEAEPCYLEKIRLDIQYHLDLDKQNVVGTYRHLGEIRFNLGRYDEAKKDYDRVLALSADVDESSLSKTLAITHAGLGALMEATGRYNDAEKAYQESLRLVTEYELDCEELELANVPEKLVAVQEKQRQGMLRY